VPDGAWLCYVFDTGLNAMTWICAHDARGDWTGEPHPTASDIAYPGDELP